MLEISLAAEPIFTIGKVVITNSVFTSWLVIVIILISVFIARRGFVIAPKGLANLLETVVEFLINLIESVTGNRQTAIEFLPFLGTFFIFIILNNWFGLLPGFGTITINNGNQFVPLLRGGNADLNSTLALAIISVTATQYFGMKKLGFFAHWKKYFNFKNPIFFFVGLLELISEFAKTVSFSFRLFGNVFAGEVLLIVIAFLAPIIAPLPFFGLEIFVGLIQAIVFTMLTLVFLTIATSSHEAH